MTIIKDIQVNEEGRDFVVGDLHGCYDHFQSLLDHIEFDTEVDRMFSVGDLVDRGPDSVGCLKLLEKPWFHAVAGNHEDMMIAEIVYKERAGWAMNGSEWIEELDENDQATRDMFLPLVVAAQELPIMMRIFTKANGRVGLCHAQSPKSWEKPHLTRREQQEVIWGRSKYRWAETMGKVPEGVEMTVHGHTILSQPRHHKTMNAWWIDLGCFVSDRLCALQIDGFDLDFGEPKVIVI